MCKEEGTIGKKKGWKLKLKNLKKKILKSNSKNHSFE